VCRRLNDPVPLVSRPPIGFIVEGHGEYNCYPSLVCRIVQGSGFSVPRVNAGGYGRITRHLPDQLRDLVLAHHPYHVIITLDLKDVLDAGLYGSCGELRTDLEHQAREWLASSHEAPRLQPLPERISVVIQVQKFESWMIADIGGLRQAGYLGVEEAQPVNVDDHVTDPTSWLRARMLPGLNHKDPRCAKKVISCLDPRVIRVNSRSFDKFYREVLSSYAGWFQLCDIS